MEKYKICPECGLRNHPAAIECEQCGEDLSTVRILNEDTEEQLRAQKQHEGEEQQKTVTMVRVCEECGAKNDPQARKCVACGEDISFVAPTPDTKRVFALASTDGEFTLQIPEGNEAVVIGRANEMQEYLGNKLYVSRNHAELFVTEGVLYITGLATATNGTYVDGVAIPAERSVALREGSLVGLGGNDARTQPEAAYFQVMVL